MSTFPAKKINRYPKLDTRAGINNIYPDTIRRLEIKIVSLTTIELNNQKNKKKKFESFFNVCQQSKRFLCTSRRKTQSLNPCKISRNRSITSREEFSPSSREIRRDRFEIIFAIGQEIGGWWNNIYIYRFVLRWTVGGKQLAGTTRWTERFVALEGSVWGNVCQSKAGF